MPPLPSEDSAPPRRRYVIVDLEATCWEGSAPAENEIIEIGAVAYEVGRGVAGEFQTFVRPRLRPVLSDFCKALTTIRQEDVDQAPGFPQALAAFRTFAGSFAPFTLAAWGNYDRNQLRRDCKLHSVAYPFGPYVNLKQAFSRIKGGPPCGMAEALRAAGLPLVGTHHRGIDDVRNIARLLDHLLRLVTPEELEEAGGVEDR
jgi:3'-5' exoribonuclease 1